MNGALAWPVLLPLLGGAASILAPRRMVRWVAATAMVATMSSALVVAWLVVSDGPLRLAAGGWGASLGIDLRGDGLAAVMLVAIAAVAGLVGLEALRTWRTRSRLASGSAGLWLFTWAGLDALVLSADVFNLYVTLELTTLAAVALLAAAGDRAALTAALRYLLFALVGSLVYLLGVAILYGLTATLDLTFLGEQLSAQPAVWTALALMTLGLTLKTALFPLHGWLPPAYVAARPVVSALVAGLLGKGSLYVLLRIWLEVFPAPLVIAPRQLLGVLAAAAIIWGALLALKQRRLKALIAYSSISQIGYFFLPFAIDTPAAWTGGVYLLISHAAAKAAMFLAAGTIQRAAGHDDVDRLGGLAHHLPVTFFSLALAGVSLMGMPPSGGFVAKWLLVVAAIGEGRWGLAAVILVGGLLAAAYVFRVLRNAFLSHSHAPLARVPPGAELAALLLSLLALVLGLAPRVPLALLDVGPPP